MCEASGHSCYDSSVMATESTDLSTQVDDIDPPEPGGDGPDNPGRDPGKWITVATFWQAIDAHLARLKLESEAIDCFLIDENLVATDWLYANAVGGIKLRVPPGSADHARQILNQRPLPIARTA